MNDDLFADLGLDLARTDGPQKGLDTTVAFIKAFSEEIGGPLDLLEVLGQGVHLHGHHLRVVCHDAGATGFPSHHPAFFLWTHADVWVRA